MGISLKEAELLLGEKAFSQVKKKLNQPKSYNKKLSKNNQIGLKNNTSNQLKKDDKNKAENALFEMVSHVFQGYNIVKEAKLVEGRRYRTDVTVMLDGSSLIKGIALELDGYRHHGLSISGFKRDREKDRLVTLSGYLTFRFFASEVLKTKNKIDNNELSISDSIIHKQLLEIKNMDILK